MDESSNQKNFLEKRFPILGEKKFRERGTFLAWGIIILFGLFVGSKVFGMGGSPVVAASGTRTVVLAPAATLSPAVTYVPYIATRLVTVTVPVTITSPVRVVTRSVEVTRVLTVTQDSFRLDGDCFVLDVRGVSAVYIDKTPVAPAYGGVRVCGKVLEVQR